MEERGLLVVCSLLLALSSASVSGQFGYDDRFAGGVDALYDGRDNAVDVGCPDFGPMDSFNAEGLQRGKVKAQALRLIDIFRSHVVFSHACFGIKSE